MRFYVTDALKIGYQSLWWAPQAQKTRVMRGKLHFLINFDILCEFLKGGRHYRSTNCLRDCGRLFLNWRYMSTIQWKTRLTKDVHRCWELNAGSSWSLSENFCSSYPSGVLCPCQLYHAWLGREDPNWYIGCHKSGWICSQNLAGFGLAYVEGLSLIYPSP